MSLLPTTKVSFASPTSFPFISSNTRGVHQGVNSLVICGTETCSRTRLGFSLQLAIRPTIQMSYQHSISVADVCEYIGNLLCPVRPRSTPEAQWPCMCLRRGRPADLIRLLWTFFHLHRLRTDIFLQMLLPGRRQLSQGRLRSGQRILCCVRCVWRGVINSTVVVGRSQIWHARTVWKRSHLRRRRCDIALVSWRILCPGCVVLTSSYELEHGLLTSKEEKKSPNQKDDCDPSDCNSHNSAG